ncbi:hypothetical protein HJ059_03640 [Vibrio parahaemolyticus]|nr:hypothetical protein [Vibrio parahaemolyticus]MBE4346703.1 hypothetical protein [Vibrio parahaemolyticus]HCE2195118.1 hypothetical protein [Vibrio parahaemolyticus]HCG6674091.1 hypothetical protein [Vibrio parahaemolyticus]HCG7224885.1 hypothetical protein [Vibrio parahaemolyticus]
MALDKEALAQDIEAAMTKAGFKPLAEDCAGHDWWVAFAEGIVNHIQKRAEVAVTGGSSKGIYKVM